ncbi:MAG: hypothetical protein ACRDN6_07600 [Gaiellaceae bacterium]
MYAIWLPMLATDARSEWDESVLADARVTHFWDEERIAGRWLADADLGGLGSSGIVWDAFFVFGPAASWSLGPAPLEAAGATVIGHSDDLAAGLRPFLSG